MKIQMAIQYKEISAPDDLADKLMEVGNGMLQQTKVRQGTASFYIDTVLADLPEVINRLKKHEVK